MRLHRPILFAALVSLVLAAAASAGPPVVNETELMKNATDTFVDVNPCTGDVAEITTVVNAVFHITEFANGTSHVTGTATGTVEIDTIDPALPDYTGRFTQWFGENANSKNFAGTFTFTVRLRGSDGSRLVFHETAHFTVNANGEVTIEFDNARCG